MREQIHNELVFLLTIGKELSLVFVRDGAQLCLAYQAALLPHHLHQHLLQRPSTAVNISPLELESASFFISVPQEIWQSLKLNLILHLEK